MLKKVNMGGGRAKAAVCCSIGEKRAHKTEDKSGEEFKRPAVFF